MCSLACFRALTHISFWSRDISFWSRTSYIPKYIFYGCICVYTRINLSIYCIYCIHVYKYVCADTQTYVVYMCICIHTFGHGARRSRSWFVSLVTWLHALAGVEAETPDKDWKMIRLSFASASAKVFSRTCISAAVPPAVLPRELVLVQGRVLNAPGQQARRSLLDSSASSLPWCRIGGVLIVATCHTLAREPNSRWYRDS